MHAMVEDAQRSIEEPEVQEMIRKLSKFGLGVFMPHMHPPEGGFAPLPPGTVQLEGNLKVSFVDERSTDLDSAVPVGWAWDGSQAKAVANCYCGGASHGPNWGWHKKK